MRRTISVEEGDLKRYLCKGRSNTYIVGHNSGVVSFYSQQCRAFHLAYLLNEVAKKSSLHTQRIGVLGGGIAGVTLWTALREYGFENVHIFEATNDLLSRQRESTHRHAHPCINEWPLQGGGRDFCSSTKWPFLNWYGATAASVLEQLKSDPTFSYHVATASEFVHPNHTIIEISEHQDLQRHTSVKVAFRTLGANDVEHFEIVVCALGYGYERDIHDSASKSYWWTDHVANYVRDRHEFAEQKRFVSGTGDGGLIDVIRMASAPGSDSATNPALEVASFLRAPEFRELNNSWPTTSSFYSPVEEELIKYLANDENTIDENTILVTFRELFQSREFRSKFVSDEQLKKLFLVSRTGEYLDSVASFANQVIVAYLRSRHPDLVVKANVEDGKVMQSDPHKQLCDQPNDRGIKECSIKIFRHGATPKVNEILGSDVELADNSNSDSVLHDNSDHLSPLHDRCDPGENGRVSDALLKLANSYCADYFEGAGCTWSRSPEEDHISLRLRVKRSETNLLAHKRLGGFDKELFGCPIYYDTGRDIDFREVSFDAG